VIDRVCLAGFTSGVTTVATGVRTGAMTVRTAARIDTDSVVAAGGY
jgi:hypothetical protein